MAFEWVVIGKETEACRRVVLGDEPITLQDVFDIQREIGESPLRSGPKVLMNPATGRAHTAVPLVPRKGEVIGCLCVILDDMNLLVRRRASDYGSVCDVLFAAEASVGMLVSKFLHLQPFVDGNGRVAEVLLAALVRRLHHRQPVIHIGAHMPGVSAYADWCSALATHQASGSAYALGEIINEATQHVLRFYFE